MKKENIIIIIIFVLILAALILGYSIKGNNVNYDFKIYFFNAGKADAIILSKNGKYIMIDAGEESLSDDILKYFQNNNITKLDYLIITHFDKDHVGSASTIIDNIEIGEVLQSNVPKESEYYDNYIKSLNQKGIMTRTISGDYEIALDNLKIVVNGPEKVYDSNESNNASLIVSVTYNKNKFLFMGDAQNARIKDFLSTNVESYNFLKVPYHGNYLNRLVDLLETINPEYGVMTCSIDEGCENETLEVLNTYNVKYYLTRDGSITVLSNGEEIIIKQ